MYTQLGLAGMVRSRLGAGNRFLLMKDEGTYVFYICSAIWPILWDNKLSKNDIASRSCT